MRLKLDCCDTDRHISEDRESIQRVRVFEAFSHSQARYSMALDALHEDSVVRLRVPSRAAVLRPSPRCSVVLI